MHHWCLIPRIIINTFLKDGTTLATFQYTGEVAVFNDKLHIFVSSSVTLVVSSFRTLQWIPPGPS